MARPSNAVEAYIPLFIGPYLGDTMHLTRDQHGGYLLLLMAYWREGGPLPDDDGFLGATVKATPAEWRKLRPVLERFFAVTGGLWIQKRADAEIARAKELKAKRSEASAKASAARYGTHSDTQRATQSETEPVTDAISSSTLLTTFAKGAAPPKAKRGGGAYTPEFEAFWKAYPAVMNSSKAEAFKAWERAELPAEIMACVAAYAAWLEDENARRKADDKHPACHAATWLNQARWETYLEAARAKATAADEAEAKRFESLPACWIPVAERYVETHGGPAWDAAITSAKLIESDPPQMIFESSWHRQFAEDRGILKRIAAIIGQAPIVTIRQSRAA